MTSFVDILDQCRQILLQEPDTDWKSFDLDLINRWRNHHNAERAWALIDEAAIKSGGASLEAGEFVEWTISQARLQKRLSDEIIPQSDSLEKKAVATSEREWRASRNGIGAAAAGRKRDLAHLHRENRMRVLGRQPNPRKRFILLCRELFIANCGQPLDQVTETLYEVVFGEEPKPTEIRDALKSTTRAGRTPSTKKRG